MANYTASDTDLTAVADAIRTKAGYAGQQLQFPAGFVSAVNGIETRKSETTLTATANDTYTPPSGSVYSSVTVNVPQTTVTSLSVTENGTYTAPSGTAYSPVTVDVAGSSIATAHITANGFEGAAYYTDATGSLGRETVDYDVGQLYIDDDAIVNSLVYITSTMPFDYTGMTVLIHVAKTGLWLFQVTG